MIKFKAFTKTYGVINVLEIDFRFKTIEFYIYIDGAPHAKTEYIENIELLQSTGLKDKNGVELYEGDVVKTKYGEHGRHIGVVKYGGAKFYSEGVKQYLSWHEDLNGLFEILGNKFEHPNLLEE